MKITYHDLQGVEQSLMRLLATPMDLKLAYRMSKIAKKVHDTFKFVNKTRVDLVNKYGEKSNKDTVTVPDAKYPEFKKEFEAFLEKEVDLDIQPIPWECIEQSGVKLSPLDISLLNEFISLPDKLKV